MTRWLGQRGQCLLCYYGLNIRPSCRPCPNRSFCSTAIRSRSIRNTSRSDVREENKEWLPSRKRRRNRVAEPLSTRLQRAKGVGLLAPGRSEYRVRLGQNSERDDGQGDIEKRLDTCLSQAWKVTAKYGPADLRALDELDPDRKLWQKYKDDVKELFSAPSSQLNAHQRRLYPDLLQSLSMENWKETARFLRYDFLDQTLEAKGIAIKHVVGKTADMQNPSEWYPAARMIQRQIHLHVGPTNSGKTYNALKRLEEAQDGQYAGPLRLLAHEVFSRFNAKGIDCDLLTGDDIRLNENQETKKSASTVEMVPTDRKVEVAVIDEIQMIADDHRGWAWTRALLGSSAQEVHLCGEDRVVPLIQELAATMGDNLHIHRYQRLNPLKVMSRSLRGDLKNLKRGDCVVSFSVVNIHALKKQIEKETGRHCAIVYGSLPPETRAQQAALFNDPDNDYDFLVASDAIGMGLNLSVKRIIFETVNRYNGVSRERLSVSQIKQIAGRAGRFRTAHDDTKKTPRLDIHNPDTKEKQKTTIGLVTCLDENDLSVIRDAITTEAPPLEKAGVLPPGQYVEDLASRLPEGMPFDYCLQRMCNGADIHSRFKICVMSDQIKIARAIESVKELSVSQRYTIVAAPADTRNEVVANTVKELAQIIADRKEVTVADVRAIPLEILEQEPTFEKTYLQSLEALHKAVILYLWLAYRFNSMLKDQDMAFYAKSLVEEKINICLTKFSANPKLRQRLEKMREYKLSSEELREASEIPEDAEPDTDQMLEVAPHEDESEELGYAAEEMQELASSEDDSAGLGYAAEEMRAMAEENEPKETSSDGVDSEVSLDLDSPPRSDAPSNENTASASSLSSDDANPQPGTLEIDWSRHREDPKDLPPTDEDTRHENRASSASG